MLSASIALPVAAMVLVVYFAATALAGRSRPVVPGPATSDLRDEPPAVVNVLIRGTSAPQAASATLLDLAARRYIEIVQLADDPENTLIRVRRPLPPDAGPYEQRVMERIESTAAGEAVAVARLVERYADGGDRWTRWLRRDAVLDARRRGLIKRVERDFTVAALLTSAVVVAAALAPALPSLASPTFAGRLILAGMVWLPASLLGWLVLVVVSAVLVPDRDQYTAAGRRAAAHWLGVAAWLRAHDPIRDLPAGAVATWDRYLAYGAALDAIPHAVRVLDFETVGRRQTLWSQATGQWRLVRVHYPTRRRLLHPLGTVGARLRLPFWMVTLAVMGVTGCLLLAVVPGPPYLRTTLLIGVPAVVVWSGYGLLKSFVEVTRPVEVTGTVLVISRANQTTSADYAPFGQEIPDLPTHYYFVVDDGTGDVLRPWIVHRGLAQGADAPPHPFDVAGMAGFLKSLSKVGYEPGDRVRLTGERWSHYVSAIEPVPSPQA